MRQAHSSLRGQQAAPGHPQVGQRKQRVELRGVLLEAAVTHLDVAELALDHPKRVLYLGPDAGLDSLDLVGELIDLSGLVHAVHITADGWRLWITHGDQFDSVRQCAIEAAVARGARKRGMQGVVCGQSHHAEMRDIAGAVYCNDGDWVESLTALFEHADGRSAIADGSAQRALVASAARPAPAAGSRSPSGPTALSTGLPALPGLGGAMRGPVQVKPAQRV